MERGRKGSVKKCGGGKKGRGIMEEGTKHFPHLYDRKDGNYSGSLTLSSEPCIIESIMAHLGIPLDVFESFKATDCFYISPSHAHPHHSDKYFVESGG